MTMQLLHLSCLGRPSAPWTGQIIVTEEEPTGKNSTSPDATACVLLCNLALLVKKTYVLLFVKLWKGMVAEITHLRLACGRGGAED